MDPKDRVTYFAETDSRGKRVPFGIRADDRTRHVYVIGKTGMGKSTLLENMAVQDIQHGNGFCFIDPHGSTADLLLEYVPEERKDDVLYFAPFDLDNPVAFNIMEDVGYDKRHLVVSGIMSSFKKIWKDAWSARMEYILSNTLLALLEYPNSTLLSVNRMLSDKAFRDKVIENISDPAVKSFWVDEFGSYTERFAAEATPAIQNKIGQFTSNPLIRNIIGQPKSSFDFRKLMDEKKIVIVNLSKGRMGETNADLLGSLLITKIYLSAMSRADLSKDDISKLPKFYLYVDEFQSFANESFADILSEARKYNLSLTVAHQYIEQMEDEVRAAVFGNVGTMITFRVGATDAEQFEKEFAPTFTAEDIVNLGRFQMYLRLMINGVGSQPFSARSLGPLEKPANPITQEVIEASRKKYAMNREAVETLVQESLKKEDVSKGNKGNNKKSDKQIKVNGSKNNRQDKRSKKKNPFQQAFRDPEFQESFHDKVKEEIKKDNEKEEVSLKTLKNDIDQKKKKSITDESKGELRAFLAGIVGADEIKKVEEKNKAKKMVEESSQEKKQEKESKNSNQETNQKGEFNAEKSSLDEVPENVLNTILNE